MAVDAKTKNIKTIAYEALKDHWALIGASFTAYAILLQTIYYSYLLIPMHALASPTEFVVQSFRFLLETVLAFSSYGAGLVFGNELASDIKKSLSKWKNRGYIAAHFVVIAIFGLSLYFPMPDSMAGTFFRMILIAACISLFTLLIGGADRTFSIAPAIMFLVAPIYYSSDTAWGIREGEEKNPFMLPPLPAPCFTIEGEKVCETPCMRFAGETGRFIFYWDVKKQEALLFDRSKIPRIRYISSRPEACNSDENLSPKKSSPTTREDIELKTGHIVRRSDS